MIPEQQQHFGSVDTFLDSIGRNSKNSKKAYHTGLMHYENFIKEKYGLGPERIISSLLAKNEISVYELLDNFVSYLTSRTILSPLTVHLYIAAVRSYLEFYDIDVIPSKFRRRVKVPRHYREDEHPIDVHDIRKLLLKCTNRRLKSFLLVLASSGLRTIEACSLRIQDVDFSVIPTRIHVRKEYSKNRRSRDVYLTAEATHYLRDLMKWKYKEKFPDPSDLVFSVYFIKNANPERIYARLVHLFQRLLAVCELEQKKDNSPRRRITLHSLRRFCKGVVSDQAGSDYSEWFLGHSHSEYWTRKEQDRRNIYLKKCMPYLTVLDYSQLDTRSKNIEIAMKEKDKAIQYLRQSDEDKTKQIEEMVRKQEQFEQLIQSLIDSGQIVPTMKNID